MRIKITKKTLRTNKRLGRLENEMIKVVLTNKEPLKIEELKSHFNHKASLETTRAIVNLSEGFDLLDNDYVNVAYSSAPYGIIEYSVEEGIERIWVGGQEGDLPNGKVFNVPFSPDDEFELKVLQIDSRQWEFKASSITIIQDGYTRNNRLTDEVKHSGGFDDWVETEPIN